MATTLEDINDLFLVLVNDYRLTQLYVVSGSDVMNQYIEGWLVYAVNEFTTACEGVLTQPIEYNTGSGVFTETLTNENKMMISQLMVKYWLHKTVNDILYMNLSITDHDFKHFSEAQNLKEKQVAYMQKQEETSQLLQNYAYKHNKWSDWASQNFST